VIVRRRFAVVTLLAASVLALVGSAAGATASIDIRENGVVTAGGQTALVFVQVQCATEPGEQLLEGGVTVSQNQAFGMAGLNPVCNGRPRVYPVRVTSFDGEFASGEAVVSAFLIFIDPEAQDTSSFGDSTVVTLH
jgi:hypothetical protein